MASEVVESYPHDSYFLREPSQEERASVFHNHMDAESHALLRTLVTRVDSKVKDAQNKIYPISHLHLGPQFSGSEFKEIYACLPNFHPISEKEGAPNEAFSTGKMGTEGVDYVQTLVTLNTTFEYKNRGGLFFFSFLSFSFLFFAFFFLFFSKTFFF